MFLQELTSRLARDNLNVVMRPRPIVKCPTCKQQGDWFATEFGPFCSKRCRLVDLGKWFNEENAISEPLKPEHFAGDEELPKDKHPDDGDQ